MKQPVSLKAINWGNRILVIGLILVSFLPVSRLLTIVLSVGENNLSNDYLEFARPVIKIMNGELKFTEMGKTCFKGQCEPSPSG